jgi:lipoate-protein ligase B
MEQVQRVVSARWLGRVAYDDAHLLQRQLVAERIEGRGIDTLLALEHDPVLTLGRNASPEHLHLTEAEYIARGIAVRHVERGGEVTYHGPGHLVVYPIIALRAGGITLREHIRALEGALIDACAAYGITAERRDGAPGCWIGERKIVGRELDAFDLINPCGHAGVVSTSIAAERDWQAVAAGRRESVGAPPPPLAEVALHVARSYATAISAYVDPATLSAMEIEVR